MLNKLVILFFHCLITAESRALECAPKKLNFDSIVCVCSSGHCDQVPQTGDLSPKDVVQFSTNRDGDRFKKEMLEWKPIDETFNDGKIIVVNTSRVFQEIIGFGGAFTDAASMNIQSLSRAARQNLIESYFGENGLRYTLARVPMASSDFSTREYSYADVRGDFQLQRFKLAEEDLNFKIPSMREAKRLAPDLKFLGSPWTSPAWMKDSQKFSGNGVLRGKPGGQYHKTWAQYFVKFLQAYEAHNLSFWGVSAQNEPVAGFLDSWFQSMGFTAETQRDFIKLNLGPTLHANGYQDLKLLILDDQRLMLPKWARTVISDPEAGIALHWYMDWFVSPKLLDATHEEFPNQLIIPSEACAGFMPGTFPGPKRGHWVHAEQYALNIIEDLNHWANAWIEWNLALSTTGGPTWCKNFVGAPIIVDAENDLFYKDTSFYAIGQFSSFISPKSVRIGLDLPPNIGQVFGTAFKRTDGKKILVLLNRNSYKVDLNLKETERSDVLTIDIEPRSIKTLIWN